MPPEVGALVVTVDGAGVALAGGRARIADDLQRQQRQYRLLHVRHFPRDRHCTAAFSSATWASTLAKVSASCAPETPYLPSMTKKGTPWMP